MTDVEGVAHLATGAAIAHVVEPRHGGDDGHTHETSCLNCSARLTGPYCAECGQQAHVHRTLTALWHDIAHGVFHFEGKVWRTLPMLAWRPGEVTRRYIHGERARFVSPLALFLFSVFLMFAVFGSVGGPVRVTNNANSEIAAGDVEDAQNGLASDLAEARTQLSELTRQRRAAIAQRKSVAEIDEAIAEVRSDLSVLNTASGVANSIAGRSVTANIDTGSAEFDARVRDAIANPKLLLYKMQSSAYKFAWALIPISLPFMWAMFAWRREYRIYDHAVFVTYSLSTVVLLLVIMALVTAIGGPSTLLLLFVPVHFYRQLKQAYLLSTAGALWRTGVLLATTTIVLIVFGMLLLALGLSS